MNTTCLRVMPLALALAALSFSCSPMRTCSAATCTGCCSAQGQCQQGTAATACGRGGNLCKACGTFESCLATTGSCIVDTNMGGGSTSGSGGGSAMGGGTSSTGGGSAGASGGGSSSTGGGSTSSTDVTGSCLEHWRSDDDGGSRPCPFTANTTPQAVVPLVDGGFSTLAGSVFADGTFSISNVPSGAYFFRSGTAWFQTNQRQLSLDAERLGRVDTSLAGASTSLSVATTGLAPWNGSLQFMSLFSSNAGVLMDGFTIGQTTLPSNGATTFTFLIPYDLYSQQLATPMVDSSKGDRVLVTQTQYDSVSGEYRSVGAGEASAISMLSGQANTITVALAAPPTSSQPLDVNLPSFAMYEAEFTPGLAPLLNVAFEAGPRAEHQVASDGWAFVWGSYPSSAAAPALPNPVVYPNPFPATWGLTVGVTYGTTVTRLMTGATEPRRYASGISMTLSAQQAATAISADLSPPLTPQLAGMPFSMNQTISRTPTVTWAAPTLGSPSRYSLRIEQLVLSTGRTTGRTVASFALLPSETSFTVPPNLLVSGQSYVFVLSAIKTPTDVSRTFGALRLPLSTSTVVSGIARP